MVGIVIIAHGAFGETLIQCATHVLGQRPARLEGLDVGARKDPDTLLAQARALIAQVDDGAGVLLITDMLGGTPANVATRALLAGRVAGVSGASLPMLVRALTYRNLALDQVVDKAVSGGHDGVGELIVEKTSDAAS